MSNIKYLDLLPEVLPHLSGQISDPLAEAAIKNAVIEFCRDSWIWRHFADVQDVVAGNAFHDFEPPAGSEVTQVLRLRAGWHTHHAPFHRCPLRVVAAARLAQGAGS